MGHLPLLKVRRAQKQRCGLSILESVEAHTGIRNSTGPQRHGEIKTRDQCAVAHPIIRPIREARRRLVLIERLAHLSDRSYDLLVAGGFSIESTNRRDHVLEGSFHLLAVSFLGHELFREEYRPEHLPDIAIGLHIGCRDLLHQRLRGIVADETSYELCRDEMRRARMVGKNVDDLKPFLHAITPNALAQYNLFTVVVHLRAEDKIRAISRLVYCPAR